LRCSFFFLILGPTMANQTRHQIYRIGKYCYFKFFQKHKQNTYEALVIVTSKISNEKMITINLNIT
jgi:hypothetical protein